MSESTTQATYTRKDFTSDQAVRWCPGCGDYAILAQTQKVFPDLGRKKEDFVFISCNYLNFIERYIFITTQR